MGMKKTWVSGHHCGKVKTEDQNLGFQAFSFIMTGYHLWDKTGHSVIWSKQSKIPTSDLLKFLLIHKKW